LVLTETNKQYNTAFYPRSHTNKQKLLETEIYTKSNQHRLTMLSCVTIIIIEPSSTGLPLPVDSVLSGMYGHQINLW